MQTMTIQFASYSEVNSIAREARKVNGTSPQSSSRRLPALVDVDIGVEAVVRGVLVIGTVVREALDIELPDSAVEAAVVLTGTVVRLPMAL